MTSTDLEMVLNDNYYQLYNRTYRICTNSCDARDAAQNACLKAWSCFPIYGSKCLPNMDPCDFLPRVHHDLAEQIALRTAL